jgi:hypothetical protein
MELTVGVPRLITGTLVPISATGPWKVIFNV